jgi:hypothetical protein
MNPQHPSRARFLPPACQSAAAIVGLLAAGGTARPNARGRRSPEKPFNMRMRRLPPGSCFRALSRPGLGRAVSGLSASAPPSGPDPVFVCRCKVACFASAINRMTPPTFYPQTLSESRLPLLQPAHTSGMLTHAHRRARACSTQPTRPPTRILIPRERCGDFVSGFFDTQYYLDVAFYISNACTQCGKTSLMQECVRHTQSCVHSRAGSP